MDGPIERAKLDEELGKLREELRSAGTDWEKATRIQDRIGEVQHRKDKLLGTD